MADPEHLKVLSRGVEVWNRWRRENPGARPVLTLANLARARLARVNLSNAFLAGANLKGADLRSGNLTDCDLTNANLKAANLRNTTMMNGCLDGADLTGANLCRTDLRGADLSSRPWTGSPGADLTHARLSGADLSTTEFGGTLIHIPDLRLAKGLGEVRHRRASPISSQTLEMSRGQIPEKFLKGCGLKDWEILAAKLHDPALHQDEIVDLTYEITALRGSSPIVPLSVFLSYSHKDAEVVDLVSQRLDDDGIRFWRDVHHLVAGPMEAQVDRAIIINGAVLLVLSEHSVNSDWVVWEIQKARDLEQELEREAGEPRYRLCPVALDESWKDCRLPGPLRTVLERYNILDFSMWGSDEAAFNAQYEKLKIGLGIYYRK